VTVKLTRVNDDVLESNNDKWCSFMTYGLVNFNAHFIIPEWDEYKP